MQGLTLAVVEERHEHQFGPSTVDDRGERERDVPQAASWTRETVRIWCSSRRQHRSSAAVTSPIAWLVAPLRRMIS